MNSILLKGALLPTFFTVCRAQKFKTLFIYLGANAVTCSCPVCDRIKFGKLLICYLLCGRVFVCLCMHACIRAVRVHESLCVRGCVRLSERACVCVCVCVGGGGGSVGVYRVCERVQT